MNSVPLLADAGSIITVIFIVVMIVSAIFNFVKEASKGAKKAMVANRPRRPRPPQEDRVQEDIEVFLEEVTGMKRQNRGRRDEPLEILEIDDDDLHEAKPLSLSEAVRQRKRGKPGTRISSRHIDDGEQLGGDLREHLREQRRERVATRSDRKLGHDVNESVTEHLGVFSAEKSRSQQAASQRVDVLPLLRHADGLRQAIILNEILGRPKSQRRNESG